MVRRIFVSLFVVAFLTSCSSKAAEEQPTNRPKASSVELADAETTTTTPPPNKGPIAKRLGDLAGADCADTSFDNCAMTFTITKVTDCTGGYPGDAPPTGTTRKLVWVEIQTGPSYTLTDLPSYLVTRFAAINAAGVTGGDLNPSSRWECAPTQSSIGFGDENWLPNKKYAGAVEIYLPDDAVKITNGDGFWEWALQ